MTSLKKQNSSFDPTHNPFLKTANPYRVPAKFYSPSNFSEKNKSTSSYQNLKNSLNHSEKTPSLLQQFHRRQILFKDGKQSILKMSSVNYRKISKTTQNPFQRKKLIIQDSKCNKNQGVNYEQKLISLLEGSPLKRQKENFNVNEIQFFQPKMFQSSSLKSNPIMMDCSIKQKFMNHLQKYGAARFSIESTINKGFKMHSVENSPVRRNNFPPTFANIQTNRMSSVSSSRVQPYMDQKFGLMSQIRMSRKDLTQLSLKKSVKEIENYAIQESKRMKQSEQKNEMKISCRKVKRAPPDSIVIRGNRFFLNEVKLKY